MQVLVYLFILLIGLGVGAATYFGLTFTPIEAALAAFVTVALSIVALERTLRRRAEHRLEKAIEDLSRLLSTDAQAGQVLSRRINEIADMHISQRLEGLEADVSVLGTVVRQVAEAVSDLEEQMPANQPAQKDDDRLIAGEKAAEAEPIIPLEMVRQALSEDRLLFHMQPIVTLPQRRAYGYDLVPRLLLEDGELADPPDFMPYKTGADLVRRIEYAALEEGMAAVRRARSSGQTAVLFVPLSRVTLGNPDTVDRIVDVLDSNRVAAQSLVIALPEADWRTLNAMERSALAAISDKGAGISLVGARSLRLDFADLAAAGVTSVRADAPRFINRPTDFTDYHSSDVAAYVERYGLHLIMTGIRTEQQILTLLEDGIGFAQGPHIAPPGPMRPDLLAVRPTPDQRVATEPGQRRAGS